MKKIAVWATAYDLCDNGYAHCCIYNLDNSVSYGAMELKKIKRMGIPVFDINNISSVIGVTLRNVMDRGGVLI